MIQTREERRGTEKRNGSVVYLDETWANTHNSKDKAWVENNAVPGGTVGGIHHPSGKGKVRKTIHNSYHRFMSCIHPRVCT